jgi:hypothetical protein
VELERVGTELVDEAIGRAHRTDPVLPRTGGPAGNARLTAWTGLVLLVLVLAELVTLLDVRGLISWHVALGVLLVPPALLKTATTGWRFLRYYTRGPHYVTAGPPVLVLRLLGPLVVLSTLGLLGSGLVLIALGEERSRSTLVTLLGQRIDWVSLHQALFVVFAVVTGVHVLARLVPAAMLVSGRRTENPGPAARVPGGSARLAVVVLALAAAGVATALILPAASSWQHDEVGHVGHGGRFDGAPPAPAGP